MRLILLALLLFQSCFLQAQDTEIQNDQLLGHQSPKLFGADAKLLGEAHQAFEKMKLAAYNDGVSIKVIHSYTSYLDQMQTWDEAYIQLNEGRMLPEKILKKLITTTAIPGTSRNHWGTEIEIIQDLKPFEGEALNAKHFQPNGAFHELHQWLTANAATYGFYMVYTKNNKRKGVQYKPWHYSYAPLSKDMLKQLLRINLMKELSTSEIEGVSFIHPEFLKNYIFDNILNINPSLR